MCTKIASKKHRATKDGHQNSYGTITHINQGSLENEKNDEIAKNQVWLAICAGLNDFQRHYGEGRWWKP